MKECMSCGFNDEDYGCACPHSEKWYACSIEAKKPENVKKMEEYVEWLSREEVDV